MTSVSERVRSDARAFKSAANFLKIVDFAVKDKSYHPSLKAWADWQNQKDPVWTGDGARGHTRQTNKPRRRPVLGGEARHSSPRLFQSKVDLRNRRFRRGRTWRAFSPLGFFSRAHRKDIMIVFLDT
jgi:hypothetical protein